MLPLSAQVLQLIRRAGTPVSKAEISQQLSVSLSAVSDHVERLTKAELISVSNVGASSGGRKPKLYGLNSKYGYLVSIVMGTTYAQLAITDLTCQILQSETIPIDIQAGPDQVLRDVHGNLEQLFTQHQLDSGSIKGIGVGIPGPVEFRTGRPIAPPLMPGWDGYSIKEFWASRLPCPCFVDNDVNMMAMGEHAKGYHFGTDNLLYIKVGTGIGAGIIVDGQLYRGSNGGAGDIGHFDTGSDVLCWCGNRGCLEATAGGKAIVMKAEELAGSGANEHMLQVIKQKRVLTLGDIEKELLRLDSGCLKLVRGSGETIGRVVASIVNFFNPSIVSVGGRVSEFGDVFLAAIRQSVYKRSLPLATRHLQINKSILGAAAGLVGGAWMTLDELIRLNTDDQLDMFF